ncbi:STAS domain-containing protein [Jatrophihabitans fulvus]
MPEAAATVSAPSELDVRTGPPFTREIERALGQQGVESLVLDFATTTFIDSSGMGVLIGARERCLQQGVTLSLRDLHPRVRRTLTTAGLITIFTVTGSGAD